MRDGETARIVGSGDHISVIDKDVQIEVLVAPPQTDQQRDVFEEASQVFNEVNAIAHPTQRRWSPWASGRRNSSKPTRRDGHTQPGGRSTEYLASRCRELLLFGLERCLGVRQLLGICRDIAFVYA